jgi:hypothetical protein
VSKFLDIALQTAREGYPVFPLKQGTKVPYLDGGFHIATRDEAQIRAWWAERPDANIAVPTGEVSGISVVDVDGKNGVESQDCSGCNVIQPGVTISISHTFTLTDPTMPWTVGYPTRPSGYWAASDLIWIID